MLELFYEGGALFMGILTIMLLVVLSLSVLSGNRVFSGNKVDSEKIGLVRGFGILAMVAGILGQLIGLFDAFKALEQMGSISPSMLAGGLKVSMITTLYGITIFIISFIIWAVLTWKNLQNE